MQAALLLSENAVSGDDCVEAPSGIRLGTSVLTSRNMLEADFEVVGHYLHRAAQLSLLLQKEAETTMLSDFIHVATVQLDDKVGYRRVQQLQKEIRTFTMKWPLPGVDTSQLVVLNDIFKEGE
jgi:glycine hydroxymethyltransferase